MIWLLLGFLILVLLAAIGWLAGGIPPNDHPQALSARLYECPGCGELKPQDKFPDDPAVPGLCAACDLLVRSEDEPLEAAHREELRNK